MSESEPSTTMPIAVLCGGLATRLLPITESIPKSLLEVDGEPFIAHQLRLFAGAGLTRVILLCGHLGEQICSYVGDGSQFGCSVRYSFDGTRLLGTGGAVRRALPLLSPEFLLVYGDSYLPTDYQAVVAEFRASHQPALMTVFHNRNQWDRSNVEYRDGRIVRYEKTAQGMEFEYIDYGLSAFRAEVFARYAEDAPFDLASVQQQLVKQGAMAGVEVHERFYEIGSQDGIAATDGYLRRATVIQPKSRVEGQG